MGDGATKLGLGPRHRPAAVLQAGGLALPAHIPQHTLATLCPAPANSVVTAEILDTTRRYTLPTDRWVPAARLSMDNDKPDDAVTKEPRYGRAI